MVSKSYVVSKYFSKSVERKETCDDDSNFKIQNDVKKSFDIQEHGFILSVNEANKEMVS